MAISSAKIWNKSLTLIFVCMFALFAQSACGSETPPKSEDNTGSKENDVSDPQPTKAEENIVQPELIMSINGKTVTVEWEDNVSVSALRELASESPITIQTSLYGGFEQVGSIGQSLPRNDLRITAQAGDIVLYSGNQMVVFYGSNTWAYTKLGHITNKTPAELTDLLGNDSATITISVYH